MSGANENIRGAMMMIATMAAFTFNDAIFKTISGQLPLFQSIFIRGAIVTIGLFVVLFFLGQLRPEISRRDWKLIIARTLGDIGATITFLFALFNAPLADVTAILQSAPLVITLAGAVILREKVGWRRFSAIGVGLFGVLLIVRPGSDGFNPYLMAAVVTLAFILLRDLPTRSLSPSVPSMFVAFFTAAGITTSAGIATLATEWQPVSINAALTLAFAASFIFAAYTLSVMVMRTGEMGFVQPFRFTAIIWAILLGIFVFDEHPDTLSLIGTAIVISMGVYTFARERQRTT
ncbi:MAG: DMT family transporter [Paracoccaceae bacterium]|nr:DMT family transporter [Paracoccaceae bacterium]MDG1739372.1 DMT family transporter [Paracoccaceae bacterium]MDG2257631.1 DMT family transporter [Paracoccaceae bacterium]